LRPGHPPTGSSRWCAAAVISDGLSISQVASKVGMSRQTLHAWLARDEAEASTRV
jgi:transposase